MSCSSRGKGMVGLQAFDARPTLLVIHSWSFVCFMLCVVSAAAAFLITSNMHTGV